MYKTEVSLTDLFNSTIILKTILYQAYKVPFLFSLELYTHFSSCSLAIGLSHGCKRILKILLIILM
jgi:hypothetical protein